MGFTEELEALGVNVKEGTERVMGDQSLYEMMLGMFLDTLESSPVSLEDFDAPDQEELIRRIHVLKGTTGNLSLTPLFEGYMETLALLREGQAGRAKAVMKNLLPVQEKVVDCIRRNRG